LDLHVGHLPLDGLIAAEELLREGAFFSRFTSIAEVMIVFFHYFNLLIKKSLHY